MLSAWEKSRPREPDTCSGLTGGGGGGVLTPMLGASAGNAHGLSGCLGSISELTGPSPPPPAALILQERTPLCSALRPGTHPLPYRQLHTCSNPRPSSGSPAQEGSPSPSSLPGVWLCLCPHDPEQVAAKKRPDTHGHSLHLQQPCGEGRRGASLQAHLLEDTGVWEVSVQVTELDFSSLLSHEPVQHLERSLGCSCLVEQVEGHAR